MRLKRDCNRFCTERPRAGCDRPQNMRMGAMDAVKVPYAQQRRSEVYRNVFKFAKDLHRFKDLTAEITELAENKWDL